MTVDVLHPDRLLYLRNFLTAVAAAELVAILDDAPVLAAEEHDVTARFAFTAPVADGTVVVGRREAAAGSPIWDGSGPAVGALLPPPLAALADQVSRTLAGLHDPALGDSATDLSFTSVYVDRYPPGGTFVAHTDRSCYGSVVAGVSVGPGTSRLVFRDGERLRAEATLAPGSLYAFTGALRDAPITHEVVEVTGLRYGITFRSLAPHLRGPL